MTKKLDVDSSWELRPAIFLEDEPVANQFRRNPNRSQRLLSSDQMIYCSVFKHEHLTQFAFNINPHQPKFLKPAANTVTFRRVDSSIPSKFSRVTLDDTREAGSAD